MASTGRGGKGVSCAPLRLVREDPSVAAGLGKGCVLRRERWVLVCVMIDVRGLLAGMQTAAARESGGRECFQRGPCLSQRQLLDCSLV